MLPVLNEQENVNEVCSRIEAVLRRVGLSYEIIFVDDLSTDDTLYRLQAIHESNKCVKIIQLSRRFGYQASIYAGLEHAQGDMVITMDSDLQHPPELIEQMVAKAREDYDIINMVRLNKNRASLVTRTGSNLIYRIFNFLSPVPIVLQSADFRLYSRRVVNLLMRFPERALFLRGLAGWIGFRLVSLPFQEDIRRSGKTKFNFWQQARLGIDAIAAFSTRPLYLAIFLGAAFAAAGIIYGIYIAINALFVQDYPSGWTTIICLTLLIGGIQMILLGIIGIYIAKIFDEVKLRPRYIVGRKIGFQEDQIP